MSSAACELLIIRNILKTLLCSLCRVYEILYWLFDPCEAPLLHMEVMKTIERIHSQARSKSVVAFSSCRPRQVLITTDQRVFEIFWLAFRQDLRSVSLKVAKNHRLRSEI